MSNVCGVEEVKVVWNQTTGENEPSFPGCLLDKHRHLFFFIFIFFTADHSIAVAMSTTYSNLPVSSQQSLSAPKYISSIVNCRGCVSTPTLCCIVGNTRADACGLAICEGQWVRVTAALLDLRVHSNISNIHSQFPARQHITVPGQHPLYSMV